MPTGIYKRTAAMMKRAKRNLALGRQPAARQKATNALRKIATDPEWRRKVSEQTKLAMQKPATRKKHLAGLERARKKYGPNFVGGNGAEPVQIVRDLETILILFGFRREFPIKTAGHGTGHKTPAAYKTDFGHPKRKIAIEVDGPSHGYRNRAKDEKKQTVLEALGWRVFRIRHK